MLEVVAVMLSLAGYIFVSSTEKRTQVIGLIIWLLSNGLWLVITWPTRDYWLMVQFASFLAITFYGLYQRRAA